MNIVKELPNNTFILENVFDDISIFDDIISDCKKHEDLGNFFARIEILNKKNKDIFGLHKNYNELTNSEKFLFDNSDYIKNDNIIIDRKDCDIKIENSIRDKIVSKVKEALYLIYPPELYGNFSNKYDSIIKYGPGYKMNRHKDNGPLSRTCTAVLYCNTMKPEYAGGEVLFYDDSTNEEIFKYRPNLNELVLFDSYYNKNTIEHSVTEIKNWERYVYRIYFNV